MRAYVSRRGHVGVGFGCLGTIIIGFVYLFVFLLVGLVIGAILLAFVAALAIALGALAVDRIRLALSPSRRARRAARREFRPHKAVINTSARAIGSSKSKVRR